MFAMHVTYVLCVFYCVVPSAVHMAGSLLYCNTEDVINKWPYCRSPMINRTFDAVPIITEPITHIILKDQPLKQLPRAAFRNVTSRKELLYVVLLNCQINRIDADAFLHLNNLEYLSLNRNNIVHFESGTFQHTRKLKYLYVTVNKLKQLQTGLFANLIHLKSVSFYKSILTYIAKGTFSNTPALTYINLVGNRLEHLDPVFKDSFVNVTDLHLDDNPWNCDCKLRELYEIDKVRRSADETGEPICKKPPALFGTKWRDLSSDAFICEPQIILPTNDTRAVPLGSNVTLSCAVYGDPAPDMNWHRASSVIPRDNMSVSSHMDMHYLNYTFTIEERDLGTYHCIVNNTREVLESSTTLTMDETTPEPVLVNTEFDLRTVETTNNEFVYKINESILRTTEPVGSIRELVSTITLNEPGITIIKESGTRIKELSRTNGPNGTTTVEVTMNVVLQLPKNLEWLTNVRVTPIRVTHRAN